MPNFALQFGVQLLGTAPQIRVHLVAAPATDFDITIPAGTYFFSKDTATKNDILQTITTLIQAATGSGLISLALEADGRRAHWTSNAGAYTLRLLICVDAEPLAMLLGLYHDAYDWDYYQTADAPATWRVSGACCWFASGYDHPQRDDAGFPFWNAEHRVTEAGVAVHLPRSRRDLVDLSLTSVPGATLRGMESDGAYGASATDSVSLWRAYNPELNEPLVHIYALDRVNDFYYLQEPISPESVTRRFDRWSGYYRVELKLAVANV